MYDKLEKKKLKKDYDRKAIKKKISDVNCTNLMSEMLKDSNRM